MALSLEEIDQKFRAHRRSCAVCASEGKRVCKIGLELLRWFHQALLEMPDQGKKAA